MAKVKADHARELDDLMKKHESEELILYNQAVRQTIWIATEKHQYKGPPADDYPKWVDDPDWLAAEYSPSESVVSDGEEEADAEEATGDDPPPASTS